MSAVWGSARWLTLAAVVAMVVLGLGAGRPQAAKAHPLGNFTVNVFAGIDLHADVIRIHYAVDMAEIPAFQEIQIIDTDGDGDVGEIETDRYFAEQAPALIRGLSLIVDGREANLDLLDRALVLTPGEAGLRTLRIDLVLQTAAPLGVAEVAFSDQNYADRLGLREIVVRPGEGVPLLSSTAPAVSATDELRVYTDAAAATTLASAREARFTFEGGVGAAAPAIIAIAPSGTERETGGGFASLLNRDTITFPVVLVMLLVALGFGAVHALEPGHGKTIVAAYFVGARGTALHSAALGLIVAVTHSLGVLAIGALTLYGSQYILPEDLYPWLTLSSGVLVIALGLALLASRVRGRGGLRRLVTGHWRAHDHDHGHPHDHDHPHAHTDAGEGAARTAVPRRSLVALGLVDGLVPTPSTLVVLLAAISLDRFVLGLLLIVAFSVGLALVLSGISLAVLGARRLLDRFGFERRDGPLGLAAERAWALLPAGAALVLIVVGSVVVTKGVADITLLG